MIYVKRKPGPPLDASISSLWLCRNDPRPMALERVLPLGAAQLIVNLNEDEVRVYDTAQPGRAATTLPGSVLTGVTAHLGLIDTEEQEYVAGVVFRPGGTLPFFRIPADHLTGRHVALEDVWGRALAAGLRERLLEASGPAEKLEALERMMAAAYRETQVHPGVGFALRALAAHPERARIAAIAEAAGLSGRRFIEHFTRAVGLRPKQYCRLLRFQRALRQAQAGRDVNWTRVAVECGFFDQAHFIHEFRAFAGITPGEYGACRTEFQNHVKFLQSEPAGARR